MTSKRPELSLLRAIRRSFVSIKWVVEVGLDRRGRAIETVRDLRDRQTLDLAVVVCQSNGPARLNDSRVLYLAQRDFHIAAQQGAAIGLRFL
jgi:hypothetical protein